MTFTPRLTVPNVNDVNYLHTSAGGKNRCMKRYNNTVLPNCTGYAWGRFMEILGSVPTLSTQDAEMWYGYNDGYKRGKEPQLGAVLCWAKGQVGNDDDGAGHVAIVEKINPDGSIVISQSGYSRPWERRFWTETITGPHYDGGWLSKYQFQGFIYNPAVEGLDDKLSSFLEAVSARVGESSYRSSTEFVIECAKSTDGLLNVVIPDVVGAGDIPRVGTANNMGEWIERPMFGTIPTPQSGDIVLFRKQYIQNTVEYMNLDKYYSDRCAIVSEYSSTSKKIKAVECSDSGHVSFKEYDYNDDTIHGYYRPTWTRVGATPLNLITSGPLYDTANTKKDAILREIGYINKSNQPSIHLSNIRLSVINYTSALSSTYSLLTGLAGAGYLPGYAAGSSNVPISSASSLPSQIVIVSGLDTVPRAIVEFFLEKGLNTAAGVGIIANIKHESNFKTDALGDKRNGVYTSFGICQWHNDRGTAMKKMAGSNWDNNLTGQLEYLWYELTNGYKTVLSGLKQVSNTEIGAREAADVFVRKFERPADVDGASKRRQASASEFWKSISQESKEE